MPGPASRIRRPCRASRRPAQVRPVAAAISVFNPGQRQTKPLLAGTRFHKGEAPWEYAGQD
jgi:hypothetical protein